MAQALQSPFAQTIGGIMKTELLKKLYTQLCDFGLNSKEWIIKPVSKSFFVISHNEDPTFKLMGRIQDESWSKIWLASV